jgi:hypothetical protein
MSVIRLYGVSPFNRITSLPDSDLEKRSGWHTNFVPLSAMTPRCARKIERPRSPGNDGPRSDGFAKVHAFTGYMVMKMDASLDYVRKSAAVDACPSCHPRDSRTKRGSRG